MRFRPGQHVVCVDSSDRGYFERRWFGFGWRWVPLPSELRRGTVYTIHLVGAARCVRTGQLELAVQLVELAPPADQPDGAFRASRFRPLDERRLEQFRAHLTPHDTRKVTA